MSDSSTQSKPHEFAQWVIENPDECSVVEKTLATGYQRLEQQLQALRTAAQRILEAPKGTSHSQFRFWLMDALGDAYPASTSGAREEGDDA